MPTIDIDVSAFSGIYAPNNGTRTPSLSRLKCLKFATSVGNAHYTPAFGRTAAAVALASYRAIAIRCVLDFNGAQLCPLVEYSSLESTEKMNLSYWIGMTFAAVAADDVLGVPRTTHALQMGRRLRRANPKSKSLADLVGQDAGMAWHVLEAKGRQTPPTPNHRTAWKGQAGTVATINGAAVATGSYCVGLIGGACRIELVDPPPSRGHAVDIRIDPDDLERGYYQPYLEFLGAGAFRLVRGGRRFMVRPISFDPISMDYVYLGVEDVYFQLRQPSAPFAFSVEEYEDETLYVGTDGVAITTSLGPCDFKPLSD